MFKNGGQVFLDQAVPPVLLMNAKECNGMKWNAMECQESIAVLMEEEF